MKPRFNADVNKWWMCDEGRYGFSWIDDESRLGAPIARESGRALELTWDEAIGRLASALKRYRPEEVGILASPRMSNEDLFALARLAAQLNIANVDHRVPLRIPGDQDDFLIRADKNPNTRGAELMRVVPGQGGLDAAAMLRAAGAKRLKLLWIFHHDLLQSAWPEGDVRAAVAGAEMVVFQGTNGNAVSAGAHLVLPSAAHVEREGTFTNFEGRVQRFRVALEPIGEARPDWQILADLARGLGLSDAALSAERADQVFQSLAAAIPAYAGMSYRSLGDGGLVVKA
jgi:NADH-quinone oxidoreductase subunit G